MATSLTRRSPAGSSGFNADLPFEILLIIIRLAYEGNRRSAIAFRRVSHTFKALIDPLLFERVTLRTIDGMVNFHKLITTIDISAIDPPSARQNTVGLPWKTPYPPISTFITPSTATTYSIARHVRALCTHQGPPELVAQILCLCVNLTSFAPWGMREEYPHLVTQVLEFDPERGLDPMKRLLVGDLELDNGYLLPIRLLRLSVDLRIFHTTSVPPARPQPINKQETHLGVKLVRMREKRAIRRPDGNNNDEEDDDEWEDMSPSEEDPPDQSNQLEGILDLPPLIDPDDLGSISSSESDDDTWDSETNTDSEHSDDSLFALHPFSSPAFQSLTHLDINDPLEWGRLNLVECVWSLPNLTHLSVRARPIQVQKDRMPSRMLVSPSDDDSDDSDIFYDDEHWLWNGTHSERMIAECVSVPSSTPSAFRDGYWEPKDEVEQQNPLSGQRTFPSSKSQVKPQYKYESKLHVLLLWTDTLHWPQLDKLESFLGLLPPDEGAWRNEPEEQRWRRWRSSIVVFCETEPDKNRKEALDRFGGAIDFPKTKFWWEWGYRGGDWDEGLVIEEIKPVGRAKGRLFGKVKGRGLRALKVSKTREGTFNLEEVWHQAEQVIKQRRKDLELDFLAFPCTS